jgi:Tfp pilus assembly protein PilE
VAPLIIELVITLACIAVLAAVAMPKFSGYILQAHLQGAKPYLLELAAKQRNYRIENGTYCCGGGTLDEGNLARVGAGARLPHRQIAGLQRG